jgi:predicted RNase H-like nuclease (RuvC/YqgF family)
MIPAYSEEVKITIKEQSLDPNLETRVKELHEQVRLLTETVEYMNRERSRMKSELDQLRAAINRQ